MSKAGTLIIFVLCVGWVYVTLLRPLGVQSTQVEMTEVSPLVGMIEANDVGELSRFLHQNPDAAHHDALPGINVLVLAAQSGSAEVLTLLLEHGADPNVKGVANGTPLHSAAGSGDMAKIMLLLDAGADAEAVTSFGYTPADSARAAGHNQVAEFLAGYMQRKSDG